MPPDDLGARSGKVPPFVLRAHPDRNLAHNVLRGTPHASMPPPGNHLFRAPCER
jgi:hypothetical protein